MANPNKWFYLPLLLLPLSTPPAWAVSETTRVSVSSNGEQANYSNFGSYSPSLSADGRFVAFQSYASNLVAGDTNKGYDIFVHDQQTQKTTRVSLASKGEQANYSGLGSYSPSLSADGRFVAFQSFAKNLVAGDTNNVPDIFVHDRKTQKTTRVNVSSGDKQANDYSGSLGFTPSLSADGRFVAFESRASNLVAGDTNSAQDIFVHDRLTGETTRVSVASDSGQANWSSKSPSLSADGRFVAFESFADNLVAGDTNESYDIFVHDRKTQKTTRISMASSGEQASDYNNSYSPNISADGRFVAFESEASNLVADDANDERDIFIHDRHTGKTSRVSVASSGEQANAYSLSPRLSADGRFVAFSSQASNLITGDTNANAQVNYIFGSDVFVHDRKTKKTTRVSVASNGEQANYSNFGSYSPSLSADGRFVAFQSYASNLVADDTNDLNDIFVHDRNLDARHQTDLQITAIDKPDPLPTNGQGTFRYTITNNGPETVYQARMVHSVSNGKVVGFKPSQGRCDRYATLSLCDFGKLQPNASMTLEMRVKATRYPLSQLLSVSPLAKKDVAPGNNSVTVNTQVTPAQ